MNSKRTLLATLALLFLSQSVNADPCGMVPPLIAQAGTPAIQRIGLQKTYVFYKDGVETFAIRPGYRGSIDNFGMLIPFPTPPAIRKVPDDLFMHITAAVDPPEIPVYLQAARGGRTEYLQGVTVNDGLESGLAFKASEIRVLREEAVGMYEVAVLEAGSAAALKRWMDDHGYKYPNGMDEVCEEYVNDGWCFVAVKTKVGNKGGVNPRPGQREVDSNLPAGSVFDGNVQAMAFRFESDEFVVPMRLSAFNEGDTRNVVYVLTDHPQRIVDIPKEYVRRQIDGEDLYRNVAGLLPLRVFGGTYDEIPEDWLTNLLPQRDPAPHNGHARELFASDLLAVRIGKLSHEFEEMEKELLNIGERLGLRGPALDAYHHEALAEMRAEALEGALEDLKDMTLTVVDGDFDREVLAGANLTFARWPMKVKDNTPQRYDANQYGPGFDRGGTLYRTGSTGGRGLWWFLVPFGSAFVLGMLFAGSRRMAAASPRSRFFLIVLFTAVAVVTVSSVGWRHHTNQLIDELGDADTAPAAVEALVEIGADAVRPLTRVAIDGDDLAARGWAIVCLSEIGGAHTVKNLERLSEDTSQPNLVRTWAAAARVPLADSQRDFDELAQLSVQLPPLARPLGERLAGDGSLASVETMIMLVTRHASLQNALAPAISDAGSLALIDVMMTSPNNQVRRTAAGYLGGLSVGGDVSVAGDVVHALRYRRNATGVPWNGGALFLPGLQWPPDEARALADYLIEWLIFATRHELQNEARQVMNNLQSMQLMEAAGYTWPRRRDTDGWLWVWGKIFGREPLEDMLDKQGVLHDERFADVLKQL